MFAFESYTQTELLHEGASTVIYRCYRHADHASVILKSHRSDFPTALELAKLRHEYALMRDLQGPGVLPILDLASTGHRLALVMADVGARSLDRLLGTRLELGLSLRIVMAVTAVLSRAHQQRIVHKDIKPQNILVHLDPLEVFLIDWGIASRLRETNRENGNAQLPEEGTLAYLAPEQTGLTNQVIDARTDLYSLGVTFYELLTGNLPFVSDDPGILLRSHLTQLPKPPHHVDARIPVQVSDIVMKLLAKSPEDRYGSARGLETDLAECLAQWETIGQVQPFPLGRSDTSSDFRIPQKLYGREAEMAALAAAFQRAARGATELVLVTGYGGVGKSSIVREAYRPMRLGGAHVIAGKFEQFHGAVPYVSLTQAFRELIRQTMAEGAASVARQRARLLQALGQNAGVLSQLVPELERVIGPQPPVPELGPMQAEARFHFVVQQFVSVFTDAEHPLVLFLDDLQWAEPASLKLLERIITNPETRHLLIIGAYRDNDLAAIQLLTRMLDGLDGTLPGISRIELRPLRLEDVIQLIADALSMPAERVTALAEEIYSKTQGNAFYVSQLLTSLAQEGLIAFDADRAEWGWDLPAIARQAVAENVADFVAQRLRHLRRPTQHLLKLAACLGAQFEHDTLAQLADLTIAACAQELWGALVEGVVVPLHGDYRLLCDLEDTREARPEEPTPSVRVSYRFVHDRVQEAAYSLLEEQERPRVHLRVARLLRGRYAGNIADDDLFTVADHLNIGRMLVHERAERLAAAGLNLRAGGRAKASAAYAAARAYLEAGIAYLPEDAEDPAHELSFALRIEHAETVFLCGEHREADAQLALLLESSRSTMRRIEVHLLQIKLYASVIQLHKAALEVGRVALSLLGEPLPETAEACAAAYEAEMVAMLARLRSRSFEEHLGAPRMTDPRTKAVMDILLRLDSASFTSSPKLSALISLRQVAISLEHGASEQSACGYLACAMAIIRTFGKSEDAEQLIRLGMAFGERYPSMEYAAKLYFTCGGALSPIRPLREAAACYERAIEFGLQYGDTECVGLSACFLIHVLLALNMDLDAYSARVSSLHTILSRIKREELLPVFVLAAQQIASLRGQTRHPCSLSDEHFDEDAFMAKHAYPALVGFYTTVKLFLAGIHGDTTAAALLDAFAADKHPTPFLYRQACFYACLLLSALIEKASEIDAERYRVVLEEYHGVVSRNRVLCEETWRCADTLIAAERARLDGRFEEAQRLYDEAIDFAQKDSLPRTFALASELCGKLNVKRGHNRIAGFYLNEAYRAWLRFGALAKADALVAQFPQHVALPVQEQESSKIITAPTNKKTSTAILQGVLFDLGEAMRAAHSISSEITGERVIERFLRASCVSAAAQRAFVILMRDDELKIVGQLTTNPEMLKTSPGIKLEGTTELAESVVRYVANSHEAVALGSGDQTDFFIDDPFLRVHRPKSLLCLPLIHQGRLVGVWYAESSAIGGLRRGSIELLQMLAAQAASALENAHLYEQLKATTQELSKTNERLESDVAIRTAELRHETFQLRETQARLVKLEKQATEVRMAGGFAHEMRNALASAKIYLAKAYGERGGEGSWVCHDTVEKLTDILQLSREHLPPDALQRMMNFISDAYENEKRIILVLNGISKNIERSLRVTTLILDYSRKGFEVPGKNPIDLREIIDNIIREFEMDFSQNRISVVVELDSDYVLLGDERHFYSILSNLIANARDALIDTEGRERVVRIRFMKHADGGFVLQVVDDGTGIAPEHRSRIFEPFFSTKPNTGTGLGLGFVEKLVSLYGGFIGIESEVNQGTTVSIRLPEPVLSLPVDKDKPVSLLS